MTVVDRCLGHVGGTDGEDEGVSAWPRWAPVRVMGEARPGRLPASLASRVLAARQPLSKEISALVCVLENRFGGCEHGLATVQVTVPNLIDGPLR
jgi:hypothetical protein